MRWAKRRQRTYPPGARSRLPLLAGGARFGASVTVVGDAVEPLGIESGTPETLRVEAGEITLRTSSDRRNFFAGVVLTTVAAGRAELVVRDRSGEVERFPLRVVAPDRLATGLPPTGEPVLVAAHQPVYARFLAVAGEEVLVGSLPAEVVAEPPAAAEALRWPLPSGPRTLGSLFEALRFFQSEPPGAFVRFSVGPADAALRVRFAGSRRSCGSAASTSRASTSCASRGNLRRALPDRRRQRRSNRRGAPAALSRTTTTASTAA